MGDFYIVYSICLACQQVQLLFSQRCAWNFRLVLWKKGELFNSASLHSPPPLPSFPLSMLTGLKSEVNTVKCELLLNSSKPIKQRVMWLIESFHLEVAVGRAQWIWGQGCVNVCMCVRVCVSVYVSIWRGPWGHSNLAQQSRTVIISELSRWSGRRLGKKVFAHFLLASEGLSAV